MPRNPNQSTPMSNPKAAMTSTPLIDYYEALERASVDMLDAARAGNWDQVVQLEGACVVLIARLKQAATTQSLAEAERRRKARLMQRILVADAQIRSLSDPLAAYAGQQATSAGHTLH